MDKNLPNKVDRLFHDAIQAYRSDPSEQVWSKIEEELDEHDRKIVAYTFRGKQYVATTIGLIIGLAILCTLYFHQEAIFKRESLQRDKTVIPSNLSVKMKTQHSVLKNNKVIPPDVTTPVEDHNSKVTSVKKSVRDEISENPYDVNNSVLLNPDEKLMQLSSVESVASNSQLLSMHPANPPTPTVPNMPLTLIHRKIRVKERFSLTPYFSQEFAGYSLTDNDLTGVNGQEIEQQERNVFSASVGVYINYKINKRWLLQSGISYSWSNSNIDSGTSYAVLDSHGTIQYRLNTISGYGYLKPASRTLPNVGDSVYTAKSYSQLHYLTIPLVLSYRIPLNRFSLLVGAGTSFNVLTGAEIETKTYGNGSSEKEYSVNMMGLKKINWGVLVKLDLEYRINSNIGVNIIPSFKNTLSPINLETAIAAYPYNFGIGTGFTYHF